MNLLRKITKKEKEIIQEIHDSFDNAQDELLKQATYIIEQHKPKSSDKAERLEKLGFVNSETVIKNLANKEVLISSKKDADLVNYYKTSYPFLKFLKEEQLDAICKKYNLIYAPVGRYKKDVPEKNVTEIENAQSILKQDCLPKSIRIMGYKFNSDKTRFERFLNDYPNGLISLKKLQEWHPNISTAIFCKYNFNITKFQEIDKTGLFIAAPKSHFNLKGLKNKAFGFFNMTITEVKDPIVFRYVKGGIQVLSKWGLEANDEMLQNEILN